MIGQNFVEQVKSIEASGISRATTDLMFLRLTCVKNALGLPSDDSLKTSDRFEAAIHAIAELSQLATMQLVVDASFSDIKAYHEKQLSVIQKLEMLQAALAPDGDSLGLFVGEFDTDSQANWHSVLRDQLDELPIQQIISSYPELNKLFEAIEIPWKGRPQALFRLRSKPEIAFPIWSQSKYRGGTRGAVLLQIKNSEELISKNDSKLSSEGLILEFRSLCACCHPAEYDLKSPFIANMPSWSEQTALKEWEASQEGLAHKQWEETLNYDYAQLLKAVCDTNGVNTLILRNPHSWIKANTNPLPGIEMLEVTEREFVYNRLGYSQIHRVDSGERFAIIE